ncbi:MAG TPA: HAMP domain-containing sensor histidine kinase [Bacteroidales bacterium]|nr:HAMP domain-containing sensor histidine kinase [Bacteroidales bacterium]
MSSKKDNTFYKTLVFRLTIRYLIFFTVFNIVLFTVIFYEIKTSQSNLTDKILIARIKTAIPIAGIKDSIKLNKELQWRSFMEEYKNCFYLIVDSTNTIIATSFLSEWGNIQFVKNDIPEIKDLPPVKPDKSLVRKSWTLNSIKIQPESLFSDAWNLNYILFNTLSFRDVNNKARVAYAHMPNKSTLIAGVSLRENEEFLRMIEKIFFYSLFMMLAIGGLLGFLIARKSMVDVVKVTNAAEMIRKGNLSLRVRPGSNSLEIKNLANAFNNMLERIEKLIVEQKEMTNNIAHDLRGPITGIRGISETTFYGEQSVREYKEMCGQVVNECDRLINMINSTLDIAEIEAGTFEIPMEDVDINRLVSDAYEMYQPVADLKGVIMVNELNGNRAIVNGNIPLLQRTFANVIDNAIKYTKPAGVVKISGDQEADMFCICISDTGIGIPSEEQGRIFEKFYRIDKSRSSTGNGLGLSLAHAYVTLHKGTIEVKSMKGNGSTFIIKLPMKTNPTGNQS